MAEHLEIPLVQVEAALRDAEAFPKEETDGAVADNDHRVDEL